MFNIPSKAVKHIDFPGAARAFAGIAALAFCIAGCSRHDMPAVPRPAPLKTAAAPAVPLNAEPAVTAPALDKAGQAELMRAIFGDDYRSEEGVALAVIEEGEDAGYWRMSLYAARTLPDGRVAVVLNGGPSDEDGADNSAHAAAGLLSVYTLRRADGAWQVVDRYPDVGTMGSSGNIGAVKWIALGAGRTGIVVSPGGTWFGSTMADAAIYDLDHGMRSLGGFAELSSNAGGCTPDTGDCWEVDGKIGTVAGARAEDYRDIVVNFEGGHFRVTEDAKGDRVEHPTRTVREAARYRFDGKTYVLVAGKNPVPPIEG